jgi:hypothetical protein
VNLLDDFAQMFRLFAKLLTIVFVISAFLFVMIEQGIMSAATLIVKFYIYLKT